MSKSMQIPEKSIETVGHHCFGKNQGYSSFIAVEKVIQAIVFYV